MQRSSPAPDCGSPVDGNLLGAERRAQAQFPFNLYLFVIAKQDAARARDWAIQAERSTLLWQLHANEEQEPEDAPLPVQPSLQPNSSTISQHCLKVKDPI